MVTLLVWRVWLQKKYKKTFDDELVMIIADRDGVYVWGYGILGKVIIIIMTTELN